MTKVYCGICGMLIEPTELKTPQPISDYDKKAGWSRKETYNCCGRTWLRDNETNNPVDCGPAI